MHFWIIYKVKKFPLERRSNFTTRVESRKLDQIMKNNFGDEHMEIGDDSKEVMGTEISSYDLQAALITLIIIIISFGIYKVLQRTRLQSLRAGNYTTESVYGSGDVEDSVMSEHKLSNSPLAATNTMNRKFENDLTLMTEETNIDETKHEFKKWVGTYNINHEIKNLLEEEELDDMEILKNLPDDDITAFNLPTELTALLREALQSIRIASEANAFMTWATEHNIDAETVQMLKRKGIDSLEKLKRLTDEDIKKLKIRKTGRRLRLTRSILTLHDTEFAKYLKERKVTEEVIRKLIQKGYDSKEIFMLMNKEKVEHLQVGQAQTDLLLKIIDDLHDLNDVEKQSPAPGYEQAFEKLLRELALEEATINKLMKFGIDSPEALTMLEKEIDVINLSTDQRVILDDAIKQYREIEADPDMKHAITEHTKLRKHSYGAAMSLAQMSPINKGSNRDIIMGAFCRFENNTVGTAKTAIANVANYMKGTQSKPEKITIEGGMRIVKLPLQEVYRDETGKIRKCMIGRESIKKQSKTIMVVGATGAGKSLLIDGMCNFIFNSTWEQQNRIKLIDVHKEELRNAAAGDTMSQTEWITIYTINTGESNRIPYTLNLIDTPGFGDTRGITRDEELVDQIWTLFKDTRKHNVDSIDAICFVVKNPDLRLTSTQRYIFTSIMSIFGKDIEGNILVMITFADGAESPVLKAIDTANLPYKEYFRFNNCTLFANNGIAPFRLATSTDESSTTGYFPNENIAFGKMFWDMGVNSFERFFNFLNTLPQKSLILTNEVLEQRRNLKGVLADLEKKIRILLKTMEELKQEEQVFKENENRIKDNEDFKYTVTKHFFEKINCKPGRYVTHCLVCNETCHDDCTLRLDSQKGMCNVMDKRGKCMKCKHNCYWLEHKNTDYILKSRTEEIEQTWENKRKEFQEASGIVAEKQDVIQEIQKKRKECQDELQDGVKRCRDILKFLRKIALKPEPFTGVDYIEELIMTEKYECKPGWKQRVEELQKLKREAHILHLAGTEDTKLDLIIAKED